MSFRQQMIGFGLIDFLIVLMAINFVFVPMFSKIKENGIQKKTLIDQLNQDKAKIETSEKLDQTLRFVLGKYDVMSSEQQASAHVLQTLEQVSKKYGIKFKEIKPQSVKKTNIFSDVLINIELSVEWGKWISFISDLQTDHQIFIFELKILSQPAQKDFVRVDALVGKRYLTQDIQDDFFLGDFDKTDESVQTCSDVSLVLRNFFDSRLTEDFEKPVEKKEKVIKSSIRGRYRLVGVMVEEDSSAMVEDIKAQETLFLSEGDVLGEAVLKEIRNEMIVFEEHGEMIELKI